MQQQATMTREKKEEKPQPAEQQVQQKKKATTPRRKASSKSKAKIIVSKSKRKEAVARAYLKEGKGSLRINGAAIEAVPSVAFRRIATEPLSIFDSARQISKTLDIIVNVSGGGPSAQAHAVRGAIAKGLVEYSGGTGLKSAYLNYDRSLLIDDSRRVEPKKYKGPKARARFQKSYR